MATKNDEIERIAAYLRGLVEGRFFGTVAITFQAGRPGSVRTEEVHKVEELPVAPAEEKR